jgi:hypothetical protein
MDNNVLICRWLQAPWYHESHESWEGECSVQCCTIKVVGYASELSITVTKNMRQTTFKEKKSILAHSFRGFSSSLLGPVALDMWWHSTSWQKQVEEKAERETGRSKGPNITFKGTPPMTYGPPNRSHPLKFPPPPKSTTVWEPRLQHMGLCRTFKNLTIARCGGTCL